MPRRTRGGRSDAGVVPTLRSAMSRQPTAWPTGSAGSANKEARRGKTRRRHLLFTAMALGPGLVLAEEVGSAFCPLSLSRRLRLFASPALPVAHAAHLALRSGPTARRRRVAEANHRERRDVLRTRKRIGRRGIRGPGAKYGLFDRRRHLAGRCVSRVVELVRGSNPASPCGGTRALCAKRSLSRVVELGPRK